MASSHRTIGVIGTGRGTGTTHLAIMAANYLTGVRRRKTAVLEWNRHGDFSRLSAVCLCADVQPAAGGGNVARTLEEGGKTDRHAAAAFEAVQPVIVLDVAFYPAACGRELLSCRAQGYEETVIDFGTVDEGDVQEFLRCDRRFVVGALSEWRIGALRDFSKDYKGAYTGCDILAVFGSEDARIQANKRLPFPVRRIPFSVDAFIVDSSAIAFFEQLL